MSMKIIFSRNQQHQHGTIYFNHFSEFFAYFMLFSIFFFFLINSRRSIGKGEIVIAVVACGMRLDETLNMIKSAIIFAVDNPLKFIIITEPDLMIGFREKLGDWQNITKHKFKFRIQLLTFPEENEREWKELFKPCAAQRLFLPVNTLTLIIF